MIVADTNVVEMLKKQYVRAAEVSRRYGNREVSVL